MLLNNIKKHIQKLKQFKEYVIQDIEAMNQMKANILEIKTTME